MQRHRETKRVARREAAAALAMGDGNAKPLCP
jgi:hypothetical protein